MNPRNPREVMPVVAPITYVNAGAQRFAAIAKKKANKFEDKNANEAMERVPGKPRTHRGKSGTT